MSEPISSTSTIVPPSKPTTSTSSSSSTSKRCNPQISSQDHSRYPQGFALPTAIASASSSESCKNTPNISRKHENLIHTLMLKSGSHSAHNSPLPHRRLDKLEGIIRDKPSPLCSRRYIESDDNSSSVEPSPCPQRKLTRNNSNPCHQKYSATLTASVNTATINNSSSCICSHSLQCTELTSTLPLEQQQQHQQHQHQQYCPNAIRRNTECSCLLKSPENNDSPRRRVESDCSCIVRNRNNVKICNNKVNVKLSPRIECQCTISSCTNAGISNGTPKQKRREVFAKSVIGEPGVFNSPIHRGTGNSNGIGGDHNSFSTVISTTTGYCSPAKSILGEPGAFASPVRSICAPSPSPCDDKQHQQQQQQTLTINENIPAAEHHRQPDQTVVSGWLKFRDNKRWKIRWGVVTKLSPAADCLHLQLYRDSKDRYKQGQTKASLSLEHFLGVETGFTLDKESNTIAIICQDVIVVLAFDTRERLMQWQVKISNHLGDDIQYLVLVSSAPPKSKMQTGPSRMHIQDHRFCLTTGVPPKLAGLWDIAYLRRYGVVDNRFCFEGGSRCGKGEGLYVIVTDQGDEITQTLKLASQAKLSSKKRQLTRKLATIDSPRKILSPRPLDTGDDDMSCHIDDSSCTCGSRTPYWPSQESRDIDYGCGDTTSVSECHDSFNDGEVFPKNTKANLERCMSCISKLGAPSMSRSSTATGGNATPGTGHPPLWTILTEQNSQSNNTTAKTICGGIDRMSICSSHGSSGGYGSSAGSEYSVPRMTSTITTSSYLDSCYESIPTQHCCPGNYPASYNNSQQNGLPSIKVVSKNSSVVKPPMPLPIVNPIQSRSPTCITTQPTNIGPYENYDIPKSTFMIDTNNSSISVMDNYDTPKNIQEYITGDVNSNQTSDDQRSYYDTPAQLSKMCGCIINQNQEATEKNIDGGPRSDCACNRVMSWADNWITLPYCKRGNGVENTGVPINRVKLSGEGKMPVMQPTGELAIYATVDFSKKTNRKQDKLCDCPASKDDDSSETSSSNYINLDPAHVLPETSKTKNNANETESKTEKCSANYTNLNFAQSLENYENSKELLHRAGITAQEMEELQARELQTFCHKCGHASAKTPEVKTSENVNVPVASETSESQQNEYLKMDTTEKCEVNAKFPGYLPMSPAPPNVTTTTQTTSSKESAAPPLPSKSELLKRIIGEKSASNPSLNGPVVDRSRKRIDQTRVPGSAMMILHRTGSSPYNRKQIMDNSDLLPTDKRLAMRKRSSSADSSRFLEDAEEFDSSETLRKSSLTQISGRRSSSPCLHQEMESCIDDTCCAKTNETEDESSVTSTSQSQNSQSVHIRRSASVPCKAQNRDSSSSNDSGVSTGSLRHRVGDFHEFELPLTTAMSARRHQRHVQPLTACIHATLPRRSKSFDPLREISFQFQKVEIPGKSTSAEAEVPLCTKNRGFTSPCEGVSTVGGPPFVDSRSTSSGTSDMSDYIETLSLSSHSSSDAPESIRLLRQATSTLRPRSGKEYQNIDRSLISLTQSGDNIKIHNNTPIQLRGILSCSTNYANITPVPENTESPSPGYQSGTSPQENNESFVFKNDFQSKQ